MPDPMLPSDRSDAFPTTSIGLLQDSIQGSSDSWKKMTALYGPVVYGWIRRMGVRADDAPDLLQEVFLAVYRGLRTYDQARGPFRRWLYALTRNAKVDFQRKRRHRQLSDGGTSAWERHAAIPDLVELDANASDVPSVLVCQALEMLRSRFQEKTWLAAWRILVDGLDPALVATELGMSLPAVYTAKSRVLSYLRNELRDYEG